MAARRPFLSCKAGRPFATRRGMGTQTRRPGPICRPASRSARFPKASYWPGHAGDKSVLLVRQESQWFAIGAVCSHYSGPLPEGLVVGDTVRCPWHHACFSLRTGAALRPPALNDVACWRVEAAGRQGVRHRKGSKPARPAAVPRTAGGAQPASVVIVGAGAAGDAAAETLRREGYQGRLTLYDPDPDAPYDRPNLSKDYLAGSASEDWIPLHPPEFYRDLDIEIVHGRRVVRSSRKRGGSSWTTAGHRNSAPCCWPPAPTPVRLPAEMEQGNPRCTTCAASPTARRSSRPR